MQVFSILIAYILDLILGDPRWLPHPVKGIGWLIKRLEGPIRKLFYNARITGIIFCIIIVLVSYSIVLIIERIANNFSAWLGFLTAMFFIYASLSIKDLRDEAILVYRSLTENDLEGARKNLSMIVGRDTQNLDKDSIIRATIESIAESTVDGIISPLFYAFLGGAPLAIAYKAVNTLDSMVGYNNECYKEFGWFSAKLDDIVNFLPSRLSILFIPLATLFIKKNFCDSLEVAISDGRKNPSLNSIFPEAAFAGALGIKLGGNSFYSGRIVERPFLDKEKNFLKSEHIKEAIKISYVCSLSVVVLGYILTI
jgi:adenosylcobinamide-phosphate synthase